MNNTEQKYVIETFEDVQEILDAQPELADRFAVGEFVYTKVRTNQNVQRGELENLTAVVYRNENERHNVIVLYHANTIKFVETSYSIV